MVVSPKVVGFAVAGVVLAVAVVALVVIMGPDPGASARAKYASDRASKKAATPTPTPLPLPDDDAPGVLPPDPLKGADFTSRPELPAVIVDETPTPTPDIRDTLADIPPPPPVPDQILRGGLQGDRAEPDTTVITPRVEVQPTRYLFNNLAPEALAASPVTSQGSQDQKSYDPQYFAPETETIEVALLDNVISTDTELPVVAGVWQPFYFQGRKLLDVGDKLVGTAAAGKKRDRLIVNFHKVILKDGRSYPIKAIARNAADGSVGIPGKQVGNIMLQAIAPILLEATASFMDTFKERVLVGSGGVQDGFETASGGIQNTPTLGNAGIGAGQGALDKISQLLAQDLEENRPYLVVTAGTRAQAFLTAPFDSATPDYGR
jgi:Bacterial conjugation TrbI-like protein.